MVIENGHGIDENIYDIGDNDKCTGKDDDGNDDNDNKPAYSERASGDMVPTSQAHSLTASMGRRLQQSILRSQLFMYNQIKY